MHSKKVILITGASSGIGKDAAQTLVGLGHTVYVAARRIEKMDDLKAAGCIPLKMDITRAEDTQAVVKTIIDEQGRIDVLFNNAGFGLMASMEETPIDEAKYQFEVNLFGLAQLTQLVLPYMREKRSGTIINTSSVGGKVFVPMGSWYNATKHALEAWSDCLRYELKSFNIDVVILEPGAIQTEFGDVMNDHLLKISGEGPYSEIAHKLSKFQEEEYAGGGGSHPKVITRLIVKAINARKPKTRYVAGKYANTMLFVRKWGSDRFFERLLDSMLK